MASRISTARHTLADIVAFQDVKESVYWTDDEDEIGRMASYIANHPELSSDTTRGQDIQRKTQQTFHPLPMAQPTTSMIEGLRMEGILLQRKDVLTGLGVANVGDIQTGLGIYIHPVHQEIGASPDAFEGDNIIEVKFGRNFNFEDMAAVEAGVSKLCTRGLLRKEQYRSVSWKKFEDQCQVCLYTIHILFTTRILHSFGFS